MNDRDQIELEIRKDTEKQFEAFKDSLDRTLSHAKWGITILATAASTFVYFTIGDSVMEMQKSVKAARTEQREEVQRELDRVRKEAERAIDERVIQHYIDSKLVQEIESRIDLIKEDQVRHATEDIELAVSGQVEIAKGTVAKAVETEIETQQLAITKDAVDELRRSLNDVAGYETLLERIEAIPKPNEWFPVGSIMPWLPAAQDSSPPRGWIRCDGSDRRAPDLRNCVLVGGPFTKSGSLQSAGARTGWNLAAANPQDFPRKPDFYGYTVQYIMKVD